MTPPTSKQDLINEYLQSERGSYNVLLKRANYDKLNSEKSVSYITLPSSLKPLIIIDDALSALKRIPSKSISVVVTSPPYWGLRDYGVAGQIGNEDNPSAYVESMLKVSREIMRVLKDDGAYFLNIGDTYVGQSLQMIPHRVAFGMQEEGWIIRNQLIWYKPNHMPSPVKCRFANTYEPIFFFTKNNWEKKVWFDLDSIRVPAKTPSKDTKSNTHYKGKFLGESKNLGASPGGRMSVNGGDYIIYRKIVATQSEIADYLLSHMKSIGLSKSGLSSILGEDYKYKVGHWLRMDAGGSFPSVEDWHKLKKILRLDDTFDKQMTTEYKKVSTVENHPKGRNPGDMLILNTCKTTEKHFAVFPEKIPYLAIQSCCPKDGIVLDPFAGSGTTGVVAKKLKRSSVLIDLNPAFESIMLKRIGDLRSEKKSENGKSKTPPSSQIEISYEE